MINGQAEIREGNFLRPFTIQKLDETGIFCGSYPDSPDHMDLLVKSSVTAVLCLQTHDDFKNTQ